MHFVIFSPIPWMNPFCIRTPEHPTQVFLSCTENRIAFPNFEIGSLWDITQKFWGSLENKDTITLL